MCRSIVKQSSTWNFARSIIGKVYPVDIQPIRASKHLLHSRTLDERREAAFEKSGKLKKVSEEAIRRSRDIVQDAKNLLDHARRLKKH